MDGKTKKKREASINRSCAEFFDENGLLCSDLVTKAVKKLHQSLLSDKKNS